MPSFKSTALVATVLALGAQAQLTYSIDPNSVPDTTRENWCTSQKASCPLLCLQLPGSSSSTTTTNTCDAATLDYQCICGNGEAPDATKYSQTIPYFECTEYGNQCVAACSPHDSACQTACRVNNLCGAQDPNGGKTSAASGTVAPTSSGAGSKSTGSAASPTGTGSGSSNTASPSQSGGSSSSDSGDSPSATDSGAKAGPTDSSKQGAAAGVRAYGLAAVLGGLVALVM